LHGYPASWLTDNSRKNYEAKKEIFNGCRKMVLVSPSKWLASNLGKSFLAGQKIKVINNGVDLEKFKSGDYSDVLTKYRLNKKYILGIASTWTRKKGFEDFMMLRNLLAEDTEIVLAGLPGGKPDSLPRGIRGIPRTEDLNQLAALYSGAEIFVNPTYSDNFPLVNIEALACGTPVITYKTGGSAEAIDEKTGIGVDRGNIYGLASAIKTILQKGKNNFTYNCRYRAEKLYNNTDRYSEYLTLYDNITRN
jgi:glycosyltransferase involved in cell wall biosynthesis